MSSTTRATGFGDIDSDTQFEVDPKSLTNVLLPLALYQQPPFPSEKAFQSLHKLIQTYLVSDNPPGSLLDTIGSSSSSATTPELDAPELEISREFLFSVCNILSGGAGDGQELSLDNPSPIKVTGTLNQVTILLAVLRCLRKTWRTLPSDARSPGNLALDLAALVNCPSSMLECTPRGLPSLRFRWIKDTDLDYSHNAPPAPSIIRNCRTYSNYLNPTVTLVGEQSKPDRHENLKVIADPDIPSPSSRSREAPEMAVFRSGCGACRRPRTTGTDHSSGHLDLVSPPGGNSAQAADFAPESFSQVLRSSTLRLPPEALLAPLLRNGKALGMTSTVCGVRDDENTPPVPASSICTPTPRTRARRGTASTIPGHPTQFHAYDRLNPAKAVTTNSTRSGAHTRLSSARTSKNEKIAIPPRPIIPTAAAVMSTAPLSRFASSFNSLESSGRAKPTTGISMTRSCWYPHPPAGHKLHFEGKNVSRITSKLPGGRNKVAHK